MEKKPFLEMLENLIEMKQKHHDKTLSTVKDTLDKLMDHVHKSKEKHSHKNSKKHLTEFAFDTQSSTDPTAPNTLLRRTLTTVADVTLAGIAAGNSVWLNGIFHINNNSKKVQPVKIKIYRGSIDPANVVYRSLVEIDSEGKDDFNQIISIQHVDQLTTSQSNENIF